MRGPHVSSSFPRASRGGLRQASSTLAGCSRSPRLQIRSRNLYARSASFLVAVLSLLVALVPATTGESASSHQVTESSDSPGTFPDHDHDRFNGHDRSPDWASLSSVESFHSLQWRALQELYPTAFDDPYDYADFPTTGGPVGYDPVPLLPTAVTVTDNSSQSSSRGNALIPLAMHGGRIPYPTGEVTTPPYFGEDGDRVEGVEWWRGNAGGDNSSAAASPPGSAPSNPALFPQLPGADAENSSSPEQQPPPWRGGCGGYGGSRLLWREGKERQRGEA
ncbi:hypothetical protein CLOM_g20111 [Closterium sp. NIES-68]|nr:hypothetical protein CLOM_g20111 [Closterium sp. NIES-68]